MKDAISKFRCPRCKHPVLRWSAGAGLATETLPEHGYLVCDACGTLYPVAQNILDMMVGTRPALTLAGWSNDVPPTPQLYERLWRQRALTFLTGENFPVEREYKLMNDWTGLRAGEAALDLGTSTGLYARGLSAPNVTIFAVDAAWSMLTQAKKQIGHEKASGIVLVRAVAENLPLNNESMDAVVVGGSLNEMKSIVVALQESHRIVKGGGRMFVMSLSRASQLPGTAVQKMIGLSGIQFPAVDEFNRTAQQAGWAIAKQELKGIVLFSLLKK